jgi:hypothetical protein
MRGHIRKRGERSWAVVVELDRDASGKRRQQWHTVRGTKDDAETKLTALLSDLDKGLYVAPAKFTVGDYLERWLEIKRPELGARPSSVTAELSKATLFLPSARSC